MVDTGLGIQKFNLICYLKYKILCVIVNDRYDIRIDWKPSRNIYYCSIAGFSIIPSILMLIGLYLKDAVEI
jgi:hypothetical protein